MEERRIYECVYNFINTYNSYWSFTVSSYSISIISIELERKNGKRKNPNVHVLQYFGLYNKYHLLDYKMNKENTSKLWKIIQESCALAKKTLFSKIKDYNKSS